MLKIKTVETPVNIPFKDLKTGDVVVYSPFPCTKHRVVYKDDIRAFCINVDDAKKHFTILHEPTSGESLRRFVTPVSFESLSIGDIYYREEFPDYQAIKLSYRKIFTRDKAIVELDNSDIAKVTCIKVGRLETNA